MIFVEGIADKILIEKLGFSRKNIEKCSGKTRVLGKLLKSKKNKAIVDEDQGTNKSSYEKSLRKIDEFDGLLRYSDSSENSVIVIKGELEDWLLYLIKLYKINLETHKISSKKSEFKEVITFKPEKFHVLIDDLIKLNCKEILKLKEWLA